MRFSTVDKRFNTPNINTSYRDLCEKVGQLLCTLSFNVAGEHRDVIWIYVRSLRDGDTNYRTENYLWNIALFTGSDIFMHERDSSK